MKTGHISKFMTQKDSKSVQKIMNNEQSFENVQI